MQFSRHFPTLSDAQRADSLRRTFDARPTTAPVWVFGYGSLMWNPCFRYDEKRAATLRGYRRSFCIWTTIARGTLRRPGLGLGLEPGDGQCPGFVFRLRTVGREDGLRALWAREMLTGIYAPHWLKLDTREGEVEALCFVVDTGHRQFAGALPSEQQAAIIAGASGSYGACRDYLANTVRELAQIGMRDPDLEDLLARVEALSEG